MMATIGAAVPVEESSFSRVVEFCLRADRKKVLAFSIAMTAAIAFFDWWIGIDLSLGVLYLLPMMLAATALPSVGIAALAVVCAILRLAFNSHPLVAESLLRFALRISRLPRIGIVHDGLDSKPPDDRRTPPLP